ncbi:MAG: hypothetical protein LH481_10545, partial [Burkholderiales bacterium]|nr:hypothetical protein [Burkholderiales bacterium]
MKPFITPEALDVGSKVIRFQCEGIVPENIWEGLRGLSIVAYEMPLEHSLRAAWIFRLIFDDCSIFEFSSACTMVVDWQEVGSLNIRLIHNSSDVPHHKVTGFVRVDIQQFSVGSLEKLVYQDDDVTSECGLVFCGVDDQEIVVAAGISPGSVSIA